MPRYRLTIEYDGGPFCGFQAQASQPSVQGAFEAAILAFCGQIVRIHAAGRTDTGVHACGQVVHVDLHRDWPADTVRDAINAHLRPAPISILQAQICADDWHARFHATARHYRYTILNRLGPPALQRGQVWHIRKPLDAGAMAEAAKALLGHHDFTTFRDMACQARSPMRTLDQADVVRDGDAVILTFKARSFLHRQVRSMVGSLAEVGAGRWTAQDLADALTARDRRACGAVAPAEGLCLASVDYPDDPDLIVSHQDAAK